MIKKINVSKNKAFDKHQQVFRFEDKASGLKGFSAWHNIRPGSATGGTRLYPYKSENEALTDVLRLSKAMSYKCAISGIPFGGGKTVIIANQKMKKTELLRSYAKVIDSFKGKYTTGTDVGISDSDVIFMSQHTPYILKGNGNKRTTSEIASLGIYVSLWAAAPLFFKNKKKKDISVAIKGLGKIGEGLVKLLYKDRVKIYISDIDKKKVQYIQKRFPNVTVVNPKYIHKFPVDVYMPCALGNEFTKKNISEIKSKVIIGGANNQLADDSLAKVFHKMGVCYIPDYVVNSGGLIHIVDELDKKGYNKSRVDKRVDAIGKTVKSLIVSSRKLDLPPLEIANKLAEQKIYGQKKKKAKHK